MLIHLRISALFIFAGATLTCLAALPSHAADVAAVTDMPSASVCAQVATPGQQKDAATIQKIEQAWLTAEYHGHRDYLECLLEPDYHTSSRSGLVRDRADVVGRVSTTSNDTRVVPALETIVVIHGNSASAHSIMKSKDATGNPKEVHFVDMYTFHDGRWYAFAGADL